MSQKAETRLSLYIEFTTVTFEEKDSIKSKMQKVKDFLKNVKNNKEEYYSAIHATAFFSLPTNWV